MASFNKTVRQMTEMFLSVTKMSQLKCLKCFKKKSSYVYFMLVALLCFVNNFCLMFNNALFTFLIFEMFQLTIDFCKK